MNALLLVKISYDPLENRVPLCEEIIGVFHDTEKLTAHGHAAEWIAKLGAIKQYLACDGRTYPYFKTRAIANLTPPQ